MALSAQLAMANGGVGKVIKSCSLTLKVPGNSAEIPTLFQILKVGNGLVAKTTQTVNGAKVSLPDETAKVSDHAVRADITSSTANMNLAEELIVGTQEFLNNPDIGKSFNVGFDLKLVRHAKVYEIGKFTNMGGTVIIEAQGKDGANLGSFLTGFMPFACSR
jgi:hypothetical protein